MQHKLLMYSRLTCDSCINLIMFFCGKGNNFFLNVKLSLLMSTIIMIIMKYLLSVKL